MYLLLKILSWNLDYPPVIAAMALVSLISFHTFRLLNSTFILNIYSNLKEYEVIYHISSITLPVFA